MDAQTTKETRDGAGPAAGVTSGSADAAGTRDDLDSAAPEVLPPLALRAATEGLVDLATVRDEAARCRACDLWSRATQTVFGKGPVPARLMLVGEQPGDTEDLEGDPFVGPAGRVLDRALTDVGIARDEAYVTNAVKHFKWRPGGPGGKRRLHEKPSKVEVGACLPWVETELRLVRPEALVLLGATALGALVPGAAVMRDRGRPLESALAPLVLVTIHPSAVLRAGADRDAAYDGFVRDLALVADRLGA